MHVCISMCVSACVCGSGPVIAPPAPDLSLLRHNTSITINACTHTHTHTLAMVLADLCPSFIGAKLLQMLLFILPVM